jgi:hypothetical protein
MPVPAAITDLSTTPGSNYPAGSETPTEGDNYIRTLSAFIAQLRDMLNGTSGSPTLLTLTVTNAANFNGDVTIGNAAGDTLTVNPNTVTLANTPTVAGAANWAARQAFAVGVTVGNGAVAAVDVFDYYLEGAVTPGVTSSGGTPTLGTRSLTYTRRGDRVAFTLLLNITSFNTSTGQVVVTGLPFAAAQDTPVFLSFGGTSDASPLPVGQIGAGSTSITFYRSNGQNYNASLTSGSLFITGTGEYRV